MTAGKFPKNRVPRGSRGQQARSQQRGVTLFGLLFWAALIGFTAYVMVRVLPTVNEYLTIKKAINQIASSQPATVAEARASFERQKEVEYSITAVSGKDLVITKENDKVVISFKYDKEVPIYDPVFLVIKYEGRSN